MPPVRRLTLAVAVLSMLPLAAEAQSSSWLENRWKPGQYIHIEYGAPQSGPIEAGWHSAMWTLESVPGTSFKRIRSRWKPEQALHIEHGSLQSGPIESGWYSAMWTIEPVSGTSYHRLRNRWKPEQALHIEHGALQSGPIQADWWSAMWTVSSQPPGGDSSPPPPDPGQGGLAPGRHVLGADTGRYLARCNGCIPGDAYPDALWTQWVIVPK